jgi:hypothetical protein
MAASVIQEQVGARADLPLPSFEVHGYRGIRHLLLPRLERVNLFVGVNNAGKTSLLEAVRLFSNRTSPSELVSVLRERSGQRLASPFAREEEGLSTEEAEFALEMARSLFHGAYDGVTAPVVIGLADEVVDRLSFALLGNDGAVQDGGGDFVANLSTPLLRMSYLHRDWNVLLRTLTRGVIVSKKDGHSLAEFVPAQGLDDTRAARLWDRAVEAGYAQTVEDALRLVSPELERVFLIGRGRTRRVVLQMRGTRRAVPIANMGDGTNRVFGIALALVAAQGGALLIDEFENGLHHSIQGELWGAIFQIAAQLKVQVFATTHSWDTVVGFQHAATLSPDEGILYRLDCRVSGQVRAVQYTEAEVAIAADQQIEVR